MKPDIDLYDAREDNTGDFNILLEAYNPSQPEPGTWVYEESTMMNRKYAVVMFQEGANEYTYLTDIDLEPGDLAVVQAQGRYQVVTVVETRGLTQGQRSKANKWIVQKIDISAYEERIRKQKLAQEIRNKLREKKSQIEEMMIYAQLAKNDPTVQALLDELASVDDTVVLIETKKEETK